MKESFRHYLETGTVRKISPNPEAASALMAKAFSRIGYVREQKISGATSAFVFEDIYEAVREASQALMELKGFKPYSHEAQVAFVKEFCAVPAHVVSAFDRFRILRNKSVYGAAQISPETCKEALAFAMGFLPLLKKEFEKTAKP